MNIFHLSGSLCDLQHTYNMFLKPKSKFFANNLKRSCFKVLGHILLDKYYINTLILAIVHSSQIQKF